MPPDDDYLDRLVAGADLTRELVQHWARETLRRDMAEDPIVGKCPTCLQQRKRSEVREVERDECCVYACAVCGDTIDQSPPF